MTTKETDFDYYEKDWNDLEQKQESSLEEIYGLDLPEDEAVEVAFEEASEEYVDDVSTVETSVEDAETECEQQIEEAKTYDFTPEELEAAIKGAQAGERKAIEQLYQWFKPLILKAAHSYSVYMILGEDAENIGWQIFYEFVCQYQGDQFKLLPGLLKMVVNYRLLDAAKARANYDPHMVLDEFTLQDIVGMDNNYWDDKISDICLAHALTKLGKLQTDIIRLVYFEEKFLTEIVKLLHKPYYKIRYNHILALVKLKNEYLKYQEDNNF